MDGLGKVRKRYIHQHDFNNDLPIPYFCFSRCSAIDMCLNSDPVIWKGTPVDCSEIGTSLHCHSMLQLVATATTQNPRFHHGIRSHAQSSSTRNGRRSDVSTHFVSTKDTPSPGRNRGSAVKPQTAMRAPPHHINGRGKAGGSDGGKAGSNVRRERNEGSVARRARDGGNFRFCFFCF